MKKILAVIIIGLLCLSTFSLLAPQVKAQEIVWNTNPTPLPVPLIEHASVVYNGKIYVFGGSSVDGNRRNTVYFADILPDRTVGTWMTTTPLPQVREDFEAVVSNGFAYVLGGSTTGGAYLDTVLYAQIQPDGTLGDWLPTTSLPTTVAGYASAIWNGRIYVVIGGWPSWKGEVYYAQINPDGSIGNWNPTTSLPEPRRAPAAIIRNDVIYVIGGQYPSAVYHSTVYYANINPDGSVGTWSITTSFPTNIQNEEAVLVGDDIYIIGGDDGSVPFDTVLRPLVNPDGTFGSWMTEDSLPEPRTLHASVVFGDIIYVLGGTGTDGIKDTIYYASSLVAPDFEISIIPQPSVIVHVGGWNDSASLVISSIGGFFGWIQLSSAGPLAANIKIDFTQKSVYLPADSQVNVGMNISSTHAVLSEYVFSIAGESGPTRHEIVLTINLIGNSLAIKNLVYIERLSRFTFAFSVQQNFLIASPDGSFLYWGQNIVLAWRQPLGAKLLVSSFFQVQDRTTGKVLLDRFPWRPISVVSFPVVLNLTSYITGHTLVLKNNASSGFNSASLDIPEGSYIVGYPEDASAYAPGLGFPYHYNCPEIVLAGLPWLGGTTTFRYPANGQVKSYAKLIGESSWRSTKNLVLEFPYKQTNESSVNLSWHSDGTFEYSLGSTEQGISFSPDYG